MKIKKIGFVAIQHIMETPEEGEGDMVFAQCKCLSLHSCILSLGLLDDFLLNFI